VSDGGPIAVGTRVSFPYGGSRRTGTVADVSMIPDQSGGQSLAYLIDVGSRKVFVQGEGTRATASRHPIGTVHSDGPSPPRDRVTTARWLFCE
jgi:hypothetical protein